MGAWKPPTGTVQHRSAAAFVSIHGGVEAPNYISPAILAPRYSFNTWGRGSPPTLPLIVFINRDSVSIHGGVEAPNRADRIAASRSKVSIHGGVEAPNEL